MANVKITALNHQVGFVDDDLFLVVDISEDETKKLCSEVISKLGANSIKDMGKVMGELKKTHPDEIDFAKAGPLIKELLGQ